jgi:hypothetical protein
VRPSVGIDVALARVGFMFLRVSWMAFGHVAGATGRNQRKTSQAASDSSYTATGSAARAARGDVEP